MIDENGYRFNVGIILANNDGQLFWGRRFGMSNAWQFPQGGIHQGESPEIAMYRELEEEIGLTSKDVSILAATKDWLHYDLPPHMRRYNSQPLCIGQKQKWFLLQLESEETAIRFDLADRPEFDHWLWVDYWYPIGKVIAFKRAVYQDALRELEPHLIKR